jgi:hypothetical protein
MSAVAPSREIALGKGVLPPKAAEENRRGLVLELLVPTRFTDLPPARRIPAAGIRLCGFLPCGETDLA